MMEKMIFLDDTAEQKASKDASKIKNQEEIMDQINVERLAVKDYREQASVEDQAQKI
jgi:hypothetical protein